MSRRNRRNRGLAAANAAPQNAAGESAAKTTGAAQARVLGEAVDFFRRAFPEEWDKLRLCPLQHGLETMGEMLRHYSLSPWGRGLG